MPTQLDSRMEKRRRYVIPFFCIFPLAFFSLLGHRLIIQWPSSAIIARVSPRPPDLDPNSSITRETQATLPLQTFLSCDRSSIYSDICVLNGDIRTDPSSSSIYVYTPNLTWSAESEKIRPYTRKWDSNVMPDIKELELSILDNSSSNAHHCQVVHTVPAIVFDAGGFTGNVYHDFNDVIIPIYISSQRFQKEVVFVILEYRSWWLNKYKEIFSHLSAYPPVDFFQENITHCFSHMTVGLPFHDDLAIDPSLTSPPNITILDFHRLLDNAYRAPIQLLSNPELPKAEKRNLVIISRGGSRAIENEDALVKLCQTIGFQVQVLRPDIMMDLEIIYQALNSSDVMLGVVGCALTHLLFQKPGDVFIQIKVLGTEWAAERSYGWPAMKMGLKYIPYKIKPSESSLSRTFKKDDPVLTDPDVVAGKGWDVRKKFYLDQQNVRLDLKRFSKYLTRAYEYTAARKKL